MADKCPNACEDGFMYDGIRIRQCPWVGHYQPDASPTVRLEVGDSITREEAIEALHEARKLRGDAPTPGHSREDYEACLEYARKNNYRSMYNSMAEDGYDPTVNWRALMKDAPAPERTTGTGNLWLCYHALKASEWESVNDVEHNCAYCDQCKEAGHHKDCMIGNALAWMTEHAKVERDERTPKEEIAARDAEWNAWYKRELEADRAYAILHNGFAREAWEAAWQARAAVVRPENK